MHLQKKIFVHFKLCNLCNKQCTQGQLNIINLLYSKIDLFELKLLKISKQIIRNTKLECYIADSLLLVVNLVHI